MKDRSNRQIVALKTRVVDLQAHVSDLTRLKVTGNFDKICRASKEESEAAFSALMERYFAGDIDDEEFSRLYGEQLFM